MKEYTNKDGIKVKEDDDGSILHFDENGNCIYEKHPILGEFHWGYDENGDLIYEKLPGQDYAWECKYDKKGNRIYVKNTDGKECYFGYDENGNLICEVSTDGKEIFHINDEEVTKEEWEKHYNSNKIIINNKEYNLSGESVEVLKQMIQDLS